MSEDKKDIIFVIAIGLIIGLMGYFPNYHHKMISLKTYIILSVIVGITSLITYFCIKFHKLNKENLAEISQRVKNERKKGH